MADINAGNWVHLNVGGKVFHTTKHTLRKYPGSFLATLCEVEGIQPSEKDESGAFLIDRDPEHFRLILNFLRNGSLDADANLPYDGWFPNLYTASSSNLSLMKEAEFYGLTELSAQIDDARKEENTWQGTQWITMAYARDSQWMEFVFAGDGVDENRILIAALVEAEKKSNRPVTNGEISPFRDQLQHPVAVRK
ncbi:CRE-Potassium channel tetramerization-type BTB domain containing protein, partial [Aphelenchoides avenae]